MRSSSSTPSEPVYEMSLTSIILALSVRTVYPRVANNHCAFWKLELGDLLLYCLVFKSKLFDGNNLVSVAGSVYVLTQSNVALDGLGGEVDDGLVEFVLPTLLASCL